jgi:CO dehydrogenase/acetyl-CoA synthase gamma subunit (corrinoid Fe-S protein)
MTIRDGIQKQGNERTGVERESCNCADVIRVSIGLECTFGSAHLAEVDTLVPDHRACVRAGIQNLVLTPHHDPLFCFLAVA